MDDVIAKLKQHIDAPNIKVVVETEDGQILEVHAVELVDLDDGEPRVLLSARRVV